MASVTYNPPADDAQSVTWGGKTFNAGEAVEVNDPLLLSKAKTNRFFEVSAGEDEQRQAEVIGGYADANTGDEVALVRTRRLPAYATGPAGPTGPVPPSAATQGSTATTAAALSGPATRDVFAETYGAPADQVATGEYEGAPQYKGPEGTEGAQAQPAEAPAKRGPGRPRKTEE